MLLTALLSAKFSLARTTFFVDQRFSGTPASDADMRRVSATVAARLKHEHWLSQAAGAGDVVLCFGNLPLLFSSQARVAVFLQNRYLAERISTREFPLATRIRIAGAAARRPRAGR